MEKKSTVEIKNEFRRLKRLDQSSSFTLFLNITLISKIILNLKVYSKCILSTMSDAFTCWQDVQSYVTDDPDYVTWFLNDTNAYDLMDIWFDLYDLPNSNQQVSLFFFLY